ncbi:FADD protein, partial [Upupa epops]|nr:FADD protein [Upupa epops]
MDPFLLLLHEISQRVSKDELTNLVHLCGDKVTKRMKESIRSFMELSIILVEQQAISKDKVDFLEMLLKTIRRDDLVSRVKQFVEEGEVTDPENQPDPNEKPFQVICDNVGKNWKTLVRKLAVSDVKLDRVEAAFPNNLREQLYQSLREWQKSKGRGAKVEDLIKALRSCNMNLVADLVE